jgi:hypothetical protein
MPQTILIYISEYIHNTVNTLQNYELNVSGAMPLFKPPFPPYQGEVRTPPKPIQPQGTRGAWQES